MDFFAEVFKGFLMIVGCFVAFYVTGVIVNIGSHKKYKLTAIFSLIERGAKALTVVTAVVIIIIIIIAMLYLIGTGVPELFQ